MTNSKSQSTAISELINLKLDIRKLFVICILGFVVYTFVYSRGLSFAQQEGKEDESLFVAQKAFEDGFYDVALSLLERFQKNYPSSTNFAEVNLLIGECYFHQNKFLDALNKFEELLAAPNVRHIKDAVIYWIAEVHFRGNNFSKAAVYYKMIIDDFPNSAYLSSAYYSLGWCLFQEQKFKDAIGFFKNVEEKFPRQTHQPEGSGLASNSQTHQPDGSGLASYSQSQFQEASFKILECLYNLKDYAGLKERIKSNFKIYSKDSAKVPYLQFYLAEAEYYLNNFQEAADNYSKVGLSLVEPKLQALSRLGLAWANLKLKNYPQAEDNFNRINPDSLDKRSRDVLYLGRAELYSQLSKFQEAKNAYDDLIISSSDPLVLIQGYLGKADSLYNLADYKESIAAYKEAAERSEAVTVANEMIDKLHYGLAWAYLKDGQFKEAITEFQKIVKHSEDKIFKVSALCQIGDTYQDSGDYRKSQEAYETILRDYQDSLYSDYVQYQLGLVMLKLSNYDGAILSLSNFKRNFPSSKLIDDASYALGLVYFQKQDYNSSKEIFQKFPEEFPDSSLKSQAMYLLGTSLYNIGDFTGAIEVYKNIIRLFSQDIELVQKAEYEIADCYYRMGNEKEAMTRFNMLRVKYPDSSLTTEIMWWLGEYYYRQNDFNLALRYFSSLIQDFPNSAIIPDAYYALGSIHTEEGKFSEAIGNFNKVIELSKSDLAGQAAVAIADIYVKQEKFDAAIETYQDKVKEYPNLSHLIFPKIGEIFYKLAKYDEALEFYQKSLDVVPLREMADIHFKIAEIYQAQGKSGPATEEYLKITYLYPDNKELNVKALLRVAQIYEDEENFKEAENIYKKIVSLEVPESKFARERVEVLQSQSKGAEAQRHKEISDKR